MTALYTSFCGTIDPIYYGALTYFLYRVYAALSLFYSGTQDRRYSKITLHK